MTKEFDKYSFASANIFPVKLFLNRALTNYIDIDGIIPPVHLQLNPTNRCNFNCSFCSCSRRERKLELSYDQLEDLTETVRAKGCKTMTVTGGGESTMHPDFDAMIGMITGYNIEVGLVTNGTLLHNMGSLNAITWIRVSASDNMARELIRAGSSFNDWIRQLSVTIDNHPKVDWAISYVLSEKPNHQLLLDLVQFTNDHDLTHMRIVQDILTVDKENWHPLEQAVLEIKKSRLDRSRLNFQDRTQYTKGTNPCLISLLKPVIGADGQIYPCCGTQYALANPARDYEKLMRMGDISDLADIINNQQFFDGSKCVKCYYNSYNEALALLLRGIKHQEFV